jgi:hypothetical protein
MIDMSVSFLPIHAPRLAQNFKYSPFAPVDETCSPALHIPGLPIPCVHLWHPGPCHVEPTLWPPSHNTKLVTPNRHLRRSGRYEQDLQDRHQLSSAAPLYALAAKVTTFGIPVSALIPCHLPSRPTFSRQLTHSFVTFLG